MSAFFTYDWYLDGKNAVFSVDTQYTAPLRGYSTLLWVSCVSMERENALSAKEISRFEAFCKALEKSLSHSVYVGMIAMQTIRVCYFYTSDEAELEAFERARDKEKHLRVECGRTAEPEWQTYFQVLCPDEAKRQAVENAKTIAIYASRGDNNAVPRRIDITVCFPVESARLVFEDEIRLKGFAIGAPVFTPEQDLPYGVLLHVISPLQKGDIDALTTRVIQAAAKYGGRLFTWESSQIIPKRAF